MIKFKEKSILLVPLFIILIVSINLYLTWISIEDDIVDNYIVDIAGRQRMLSKQILSEFLQEEIGLKTDLKKSIDLFHEHLSVLEMGGDISQFTNSNDTIIIPSPATPRIKELLTKQRKLFHAFTEIIYRHHKITTQRINTNQDYFPIIELNNKLTDISNEIVISYDRHFQNTLKKSIRLRSLLSILIILMGMALIYIFYRKDTITRELALAKKTALDAIQTKSSFFANISHEIRNPLNVIISIPDVLESTRLSPEQYKYVEMLKYTGKHLLTLINDILDFSKIESGKTRLNIETFDLKKFAKSVVEFNSFKAKEKNILIKLSWDQKINPFVKGDLHRLRQILDNFIGNSIKFTDNGHIEISINQINSTQDLQIIEFKVSDTGIGISEGDIPKIFNAFVQAEANPLRKRGGTGLGMAISKQLVEIMGGKIIIESRLGIGTCMTFRIPMENSSENLETNHEEKLPIITNTILKKKISLLVVDDSLDNLTILKSLLESDGRFLVTTAENGLVALEIFKTQKFDIVLMDMQMPHLDGTQTARAMKLWEEKNHLKPTPLIALTASTLNAAPTGFDDFTLKPTDKHKLLSIIARNVKMHSEMNKSQSSYEDTP